MDSAGASSATGSIGSQPTGSQAANLAEYDIRTALLGKTCLVHITDGRAYRGTFACVDSGRNLLLNNATEYRAATATSSDDSASLERAIQAHHRRFVGLVMIPGGHITKLEVQTRQNGFPRDPSAYV